MGSHKELSTHDLVNSLSKRRTRIDVTRSTVVDASRVAANHSQSKQSKLSCTKSPVHQSDYDTVQHNLPKVMGGNCIIMNSCDCRYFSDNFRCASAACASWGWGGGKLSQASRRLGAPPSARTIKYARMYHLKKKNSKTFSPKGPSKNIWGSARMFPRAPLWLSTGLRVRLITLFVNFLHHLQVKMMMHKTFCKCFCTSTTSDCMISRISCLFLFADFFLPVFQGLFFSIRLLPFCWF